eukprot:NODE_6354_length_895_cov_34.914508_g5762_i0.p1 GENE.NODE_6354_length_895_cov_34.914508_g5762_i0~~NODE_6354_length_895_cov_34.914508_g5762_i0.p1  ORF type:complete len:246 (-),score=81.08 NODE_6354_length_895_cov_34.914508_g5762_i0:156-839(-)
MFLSNHNTIKEVLLFPAMKPRVDEPNAAPPADSSAPPTEEKGKKSKGGDNKNKGKSGDAAPAEGACEDASAFDIRVGRIVSVEKHPNADSLYLEQIDVGEEKPRQIVSGLVKYIPIDQMQNAMVLVMCNLKPAPLREVMSFGMVLCASNEDKTQLELVPVPEGAKAGDRVTFPGLKGQPVPEVPKKKLEKLLPGFKTDDEGVATWNGVPFTLPSGVCKSNLKNSRVS